MKKIFIIILLLTSIFSSYFYYEYQETLKGFEDNSKITISFPYGTSVQNIIKTLEEKKVIKKSWPMFLYLKQEKKLNNLQAGDYIIKRGTPIPELSEILSNAHPTEIPLRINEGLTIEDIDNLLVKKELIKTGEFIQCTKECKFPEHQFVYDGNLEGYLFPDTYFINTKTFKIKSFISRMLNNFKQKFLSEKVKLKYKKQGKTLKEIVIMASIIEKEENNKQNKNIISGILWKRLREKIPLGADATTRYYKKNKAVLTKSDFLEENPYNTRKNLGLPPTAISNPSLSSLKASLNPEKSPYYYYLHDPSGNIHYSKTNNEHNQKKYQYLR
jgi:UPF0755 protein